MQLICLVLYEDIVRELPVLSLVISVNLLLNTRVNAKKIGAAAVNSLTQMLLKIKICIVRMFFFRNFDVLPSKKVRFRYINKYMLERYLC